MKYNFKRYLLGIIILTILICTIPIFTNSVHALTYNAALVADSLAAYIYSAPTEFYVFPGESNDYNTYYKVGNNPSLEGVFHAALKFDMSSADINNARYVKLKLHIHELKGNPNISIYGTNNDTWDKDEKYKFPLTNSYTEIDKNDTPFVTTTIGTLESGDYKTFDVTEIAKSTVSTTDNLLSLILMTNDTYVDDVDDVDANSYFSFNSMEDTNADFHPSLEITEYSVPTVTTEVTNADIGKTYATINCNIVDDGGKALISRGVEYKKKTDSTFIDVPVALGNAAYNVPLSELESNTTYVVRAYAINEKGISDNDYIEFTTLPSSANISASQPLTENNLDGSYISVALDGTIFTDSTLLKDNFTLNNPVTGLSVESIEYVDSSNCKVHLAFDGTDFDLDISNLSISIAGSELASGVSMTSANELSIAAYNEAKVLSVTVPADGIYKAGSVLCFTVNYSNSVNVIGTPYITLNLDNAAAINASYLSGSGTSSLCFSCTVPEDQEEAAIADIDSDIVLSGGTIKDSSNVNAELTLAGTASTTGIMLDGTKPEISSLSPANSSIDIDVATNFAITFDEDVILDTGNIVIKNSANEIAETIPVTGGRISVLDNIVTIDPASNLTGETGYYILVEPTAIKDLAGNYFAGIDTNIIWSFTTTDITAPSILSTNPADNTPDADNTSNLSILFSEKVTQGIGNILLKKASDNSTVITQITGWGTETLTIDPASDLGSPESYYVLIDIDAVKDGHNNYFAGISDNSVWNFTTADTIGPIINSVNIPSGVYIAGQDMNFICSFNENITVTAGGSLKLNIGGLDKYALYDGIVSSNELRYKYTVEANVNDYDGIAVVSLDGSDIKDMAGNSANITLNGVSDTSGIIIDGTSPAIDDNNPNTIYLPIENKLTLKITENRGFESGLGSCAVDVSKFTVKDGINSRALTAASSAVITDSSTITITLGGSDLAAIEAFTSGERISSISAAAGGIIDAAGNGCALDIDNTVNTQISMSISSDTAMTEENLDARYIVVTLYGTKFIDNELTASGFVLNNKPSGLQIKEVSYTNPTQCKIYLQYDGSDFDTSISDFNLTILSNELAYDTALTSQNNLGITATADAESLTISGDINEGSEDTGIITVKIIGGTFNTIAPANWSITNLPIGVTVEAITKVDSNTVTICLQGNRTRDYDTDITNVSVSCTASEFSEPDSGITELTATTGVTFIAVNDSESMTISTADTIKEGEEAGKVINVTIAGATIESNNISDWTVNNLPSGVAIDTIEVTGPQAAAITLKGNSTEDYDLDKPITVTCTASAYSDSAGIELTSTNSIIFIAKVNPAVATNSSAESLTAASVTIKGNVTSDGNDIILERGIEYKKSTDSSYISTAALIADIGVYSVSLTELCPFTAYDARAYVRNNEGTAYGEVISFTTEKTNNANLSSLILSSGTIVFDPSNTSYNTNVANHTTAITITPTASEPTAIIKVNDVLINSGESSQPIDLSVGSNNISIVVTVDNGATVKTYSLTINRSAARASTVPPPSYNNLADIIINGSNSRMATVDTELSDGILVTTVNIDANKLGAYLDSLPDQPNSVVIPVNTDANAIICKLSGTIISRMAEQKTTLEVRTPDISYSIPLSAIDLLSALQQLGGEVNLDNVTINIQIAQSDENTMEIVEDTANKNHYQIVVEPLDFEVTITCGDKTVRVNDFKDYVERTIAIPEGIDPSKITTGVVLNSDGTFSHVPTAIIKVGDRYFAKINSLTNSTYLVIGNELSFKDMEKHWAKDIVNNLGSRLVINGANKDTFNPDKEITRAEFAAIIVKALGIMRPDTGKEIFSDVKCNSWYFDAVSIAYKYGIVKGYNGAFKPENKITREEALVMLARAMELTKLKNNLSDAMQNTLLAKFKDGGQVSVWAKASTAACLNSKIVVGTDNNILPSKNITRAETAVMISRMLKAAGLI